MTRVQVAHEPITILLHDNGEDVETARALPVCGPADRMLVRLDNVPFLRAKPTYGDVIEVRRAEIGLALRNSKL